MYTADASADDNIFFMVQWDTIQTRWIIQFVHATSAGGTGGFANDHDIVDELHKTYLDKDAGGVVLGVFEDYESSKAKLPATDPRSVVFRIVAAKVNLDGSSKQMLIFKM